MAEYIVIPLALLENPVPGSLVKPNAGNAAVPSGKYNLLVPDKVVVGKVAEAPEMASVPEAEMLPEESM